jgi:hypothetical protein
MKLSIGAAAFGTILVLASGSAISPASAAAANTDVKTMTQNSAAGVTDLSSRRRHHGHFGHVPHHRHFAHFRHHRHFGFYHAHYYRHAYRLYRSFGLYRPRPYYGAYYRPAYAYYRPAYAYYGPPYYYNPYYGPRTFVSIGPFGFGFGFGRGFS